MANEYPTLKFRLSVKPTISASSLSVLSNMSGALAVCCMCVISAHKGSQPVGAAPFSALGSHVSAGQSALWQKGGPSQHPHHMPASVKHYHPIKNGQLPSAARTIPEQCPCTACHPNVALVACAPLETSHVHRNK